MATPVDGTWHKHISQKYRICVFDFPSLSALKCYVCYMLLFSCFMHSAVVDWLIDRFRSVVLSILIKNDVLTIVNWLIETSIFQWDTCSLSKNLGNVVRCNENKLHLYSTSINCEMLGMSCLRHNKLMVLWFVFRIKDYNKRQEIQNCLFYICYLCS